MSAAIQRSPVSDGRSRRPCDTASDVTGSRDRRVARSTGTGVPYPGLDTLMPMVGSARAPFPPRAPFPARALASAQALASARALLSPRAVRPGSGSLATRLVVAAWCLLSVGASAHEGEYTLPGLVCVVVGLALLATVVGGGMAPRRPTRAELGVAVGVSLVSAVAHPVDRLMHTGHADLVAIQVLAAMTAAAAAATLLWRRHATAAWAACTGLA